MALLRVIALPFALIYGLVLWLRHKAYDLGLLSSHQADVPVVIVGNLELGGTGKSPHTMALVSGLASSFRLGVLSRGYGRKSSGQAWVQLHSVSAEVGDEPLMFKHRFPDIPILVDADRVRGIKTLGAEGCDLVILDDAYQHRRLAGGFRVLLTPASRPFWNEALLPAGRRRDIRSRWRAADAIVKTRSGDMPNRDWPKAMQESTAVKLATRMEFGALSIWGDGTEVIASHFVSCTGLASSTSFLEELGRRGIVLEHLDFPDHHAYSESDVIKLKEILSRHTEASPILVTTEKDAVKLHPLLPMDIPLHVLPMNVAKDEQFQCLVDAIEKYARNY